MLSASVTATLSFKKRQTIPLSHIVRPFILKKRPFYPLSDTFGGVIVQNLVMWRVKSQ